MCNHNTIIQVSPIVSNRSLARISRSFKEVSDLMFICVTVCFDFENLAYWGQKYSGAITCLKSERLHIMVDGLKRGVL